jgi:uncharacterized membrane protein YraQ (UPF0718 family)
MSYLRPEATSRYSLFVGWLMSYLRPEATSRYSLFVGWLMSYLRRSKTKQKQNKNTTPLCASKRKNVNKT